MEFLKINGAHGEGGGQIVRSAITLSCITNQPIHLENIRKNRKNSGLKPQHLTAIKILQKISNAKVTGDKLGSTELKFIPGEIKNSELIEDVKTAGSIALILQVLIPAVSISKKKLSCHCTRIKNSRIITSVSNEAYFEFIHVPFVQTYHLYTTRRANNELAEISRQHCFLASCDA